MKRSHPVSQCLLGSEANTFPVERFDFGGAHSFFVLDDSPLGDAIGNLPHHAGRLSFRVAHYRAARRVRRVIVDTDDFHCRLVDE